MTCQYGDWLKPTEGRPRSPSKKDSTHTGMTREDEEVEKQSTSTNGRKATKENWCVVAGNQK